MPEVLHPFQGQLDRMEHKLDRLLAGETTAMTSMETLAANVKRNTDVIASARQTLAGLANQIRQAGTNQAKLDALASALETDDADLATAIVESTPAAPALQPPTAV